MMTASIWNAEKTRFTALIGMASGLTAFDETSLGVALPTLLSEFNTTTAATHWVVNAYLLVMASLVAVSGRLADYLPADKLWRFGLAVFALMSVAAGFAPDIGWLITARAVQGLGAALIFTSSVVLIGKVIPDNQRGRAFGIFSSLTTVFILAGPVAGGLLTEYLSWRWIFWITVPPALVGLWALRLPQSVVPESPGSARIDLPGLVLQIICIASLSIALMQGSSWGWTAMSILGLLVVAILSGVAFIAVEMRSDAPLVDLTLFRNASVAASLATLFMAQYRRVGTSIYLALFLRDGLGLSPFTAGLAMMPVVVLLPLSTIVIGRCADRFGARIVMLTGTAAMGIGVMWIALATGLRSYWVLFPALLLISCFAPSMFGPSRKAMMGVMPADRTAQLSGLSVTAQMLASTLTISIGSVLLAITGAVWPIFFVMAVALLPVWLFDYFCVARSAPASNSS